MDTRSGHPILHGALRRRATDLAPTQNCRSAVPRSRLIAICAGSRLQARLRSLVGERVPASPFRDASLAQRAVGRPHVEPEPAWPSHERPTSARRTPFRWSSRLSEAVIPGGGEVSDERRGLSPADQEKLGAAWAEIFAKAREAEEFEQLARSLQEAEAS